MIEIVVNFGALAPPMKAQIGHLVSKYDCAKFQKIADSITMLSIHGYMSESQVHKSRTRCMKAIRKAALDAAKGGK